MTGAAGRRNVVAPPPDVGLLLAELYRRLRLVQTLESSVVVLVQGSIGDRPVGISRALSSLLWRATCSPRGSTNPRSLERSSWGSWWAQRVGLDHSALQSSSTAIWRLDLFDEAELSLKEAESQDQQPRVRIAARRRARPKRLPLPEALPRVEVLIDISESDKHVCAGLSYGSSNSLAELKSPNSPRSPLALRTIPSSLN